jgi:UDP-glucose 4-epimerase
MHRRYRPELTNKRYVLETINRVPAGKSKGFTAKVRPYTPFPSFLCKLPATPSLHIPRRKRGMRRAETIQVGNAMTILVTGGAGYIGSHTVRALVDAGESVVVVDNLSTGFSQFLPEGVPLFIGDVSDENLVESVIAAHNVSSIIHFAGSVVVPDSMHDPLGYYRNNTMTTRNLLNAAVRCNISRFIFSSTAAVYGNPDQMPVPEEAPTRPLSPYGSSKLMTEIMLHDVATAHGMHYVVLRYFNVAGADPQARIGLATVGATHLLKIAVEAATGQRAKIDVFGTDYPTADGSCIRDFIHVSDLAQAHCAALAYLEGGGPSATLNCGYGRGYSVLETIEAVRRASGRNFAVQYAERRPGDIMSMIANTARIRATLDWTPQYENLDTIARHALAWEEKLLSERLTDQRHAVPA